MQMPNPPVVQAEQSQEVPEEPATTPAPDQSALAVVAEFLERTKDYDLASTETNSTHIPEPRPSWQEGADRSNFNRRPAYVTRQAHAPTTNDLSPQVGSRTAFANSQVTLTAKPIVHAGPALPRIEKVSIRSNSHAMVAATRTEETNAMNGSMIVDPVETGDIAERFLEEIERQAEAQKSFASEWALRLSLLALGRHVPVTESGKSLSQDGSEILESFVRVAEAVRGAASNPLLPGEDAIRRTDELRKVLADRADPIVTQIALCKKVATFGVYDELDTSEIVVGRGLQTIVYSEVRNLRAERTEDGRFRTLVSTRLELLTAAGESLWHHEVPDIVDICRRRRTDFFIAQRVNLPPFQQEGEYILKVLVEDKNSGKASETIHRINVPGNSFVRTG